MVASGVEWSPDLRDPRPFVASASGIKEVIGSFVASVSGSRWRIAGKQVGLGRVGWGMSGFGEAGTAKYVALTTFRKDGIPVSTPLWAALDGDRLVMWTRTESWKVKRIRRNPEVIVQACDAGARSSRANLCPDGPRFSTPPGTERARGLIIAKYGSPGGSPCSAAPCDVARVARSACRSVLRAPPDRH